MLVLIGSEGAPSAGDALLNPAGATLSTKILTLAGVGSSTVLMSLAFASIVCAT
jgi:hypothetical protein